MELEKISYFCLCFLLTLVLEIINANLQYEPHLRVGSVNVDLPKSPPKNHAVKDLYHDAEVFAHRYDRRLRSIENLKNSIRVAKKLDYDFQRDLNHLKSHIRHVRNDIPSPTINDANLFQLVNEFVRKLAMVSMQTHCFIYGCPNMTPAPPIFNPPIMSTPPPANSGGDQPPSEPEQTEEPGEEEQKPNEEPFFKENVIE